MPGIENLESLTAVSEATHSWWRLWFVIGTQWLLGFCSVARCSSQAEPARPPCSLLQHFHNPLGEAPLFHCLNCSLSFVRSLLCSICSDSSGYPEQLVRGIKTNKLKSLHLVYLIPVTLPHESFSKTVRYSTMKQQLLEQACFLHPPMVCLFVVDLVVTDARKRNV